MSKDHKPHTLGAITSKGIKKVNVSAPTSSLQPTDQIESIIRTQSVQVTSAVEQIKAINQIQTDVVIDQVHEADSLHSLFENLLSEQAQALEAIKTQVNAGILNEDQAEEQLLLLMLSQSMNLPTMIAKQILPDFKQSISEIEELRSGLRTLWQR